MQLNNLIKVAFVCLSLFPLSSVIANTTIDPNMLVELQYEDEDFIENIDESRYAIENIVNFTQDEINLIISTKRAMHDLFVIKNQEFITVNTKEREDVVNEFFNQRFLNKTFTEMEKESDDLIEVINHELLNSFKIDYINAQDYTEYVLDLMSKYAPDMNDFFYTKMLSILKQNNEDYTELYQLMNDKTILEFINADYSQQS